MTSAEHLAEQIAAAHGGVDRFLGCRNLSVRFSSGGLLFRSKGQPTTLADVGGEFSVSQQSVRLAGRTPEPWEYRAENSADLANDVDMLRRPARLLRWGVTDIAAFAAMAMWTYLTVPFVVAQPGAQLKLLPPRRGLRRLQVRLPPGTVTHCAVQLLHIDDDGLIRRHDYTARAVGQWARATQTLNEYKSFGGVSVATRRRVTPRLAGRSVPAPTLVWIRIDEVRPAVTAP
ncbi:MAG: hypothetical protein ACLQGN_30430 [Mycobacterium sp.]|uniref:hypothetical protein n=2 Tax=Mycobacterium sp. TaxID=1785 RepID=UPI003F945379